MPKLRTDMDENDFAYITSSLHIMKPSTKNLVVTGVYEAMPDDQNVSFRMQPIEGPGHEETTVMLSVDYIADKIGNGFFEVDIPPESV